jgi:hypothetical protein
MGVENLPQPEFDPQTVQPLESHYIDSPIPHHTAAWTDPMLGLPDVPDTLGSDLVNGQNLAFSWQLTPKTGNFIYLQHVQNRAFFTAIQRRVLKKVF